MNILTTKEINKALLLKDAFRGEIEFSGVSIDTRTIKRGNLFIPIKGKNHDGHNYIDEAFEKGAYASLVEFKKKQFLNAEVISDKSISIPLGPHLKTKDLNHIVNTLKKILA